MIELLQMELEVRFRLHHLHLRRLHAHLLAVTQLHAVPSARALEGDDGADLAVELGAREAGEPHPPPLDIREGGLDLLFASYKLLLASLGGYLTEGPKIDAARLATLLSHVAGAELAFLKAGEKERKEAMREASAAASSPALNARSPPRSPASSIPASPR